MAELGNLIIYIIMFCTLLGALASIRDPEKGLGKEFITGLHCIGPVFIPVAGIMAAIPYLSQGINRLAFTANFQPTMIMPIVLGKLAGGAFAVALALVISVPAAEALEKLEESPT